MNAADAAAAAGGEHVVASGAADVADATATSWPTRGGATTSPTLTREKGADCDRRVDELERGFLFT